MNQNNQSEIGKVLLMLQCCHSILGTAWPRPGCQELARAGAFIGTKLFTALENGARQLSDAVEDASHEGLETKLVQVWRHCDQVIQLLKLLKSQSRHPAIDPAFNLLYLATGVLYHQIAGRQSSSPVQDKRFTTVEDLEKLLTICEWQAGVTPDLVTRIDGELVELLRQLSALTPK